VVENEFYTIDQSSKVKDGEMNTPQIPKRTAINWTQIKLAYVHNGARVADLAVDYGVKEETIAKRVVREGWSEERANAEQQAYADAAGAMAKQRAKDLVKFNDDDLKIARALRGRVAKRLGELDQMTQEPKAIPPNELRQLASVAEAAQKMGRLALGASTDNLGVGGPGGEGPVPVTNISKEDYLLARKEALEEF
jgi:hypothetical protein